MQEALVSLRTNLVVLVSPGRAQQGIWDAQVPKRNRRTNGRIKAEARRKRETLFCLVEKKKREIPQ
jgi:hypothetical protein